MKHSIDSPDCPDCLGYGKTRVRDTGGIWSRQKCGKCEGRGYLLTQFQKACRWLDSKCEYPMPVALTRNGLCAFIAYIYRLDRGDKSSVYYCVEMAKQFKPKSVKRICRY